MKGTPMAQGGRFEGWYCKQAGRDGVLALILGRWEKGDTGGCFIQAVTREGSWQADLPLEEWWERPGPDHNRRPMVRVGSSYFTPAGAWLDLDHPNLQLRGELRYGPLRPLGWDIMGPFVLLSGMECRHLVVSQRHVVEGWAEVNGRPMGFAGGVGYWEGDRGRAFPRSYLWAQCNRFDRAGFSLMAAVAEIPLGPVEFTGCICSLVSPGGELRLATYLGAQVVEWGPGRAIIRQGEWCLTVRWQPGQGHPLAAPTTGGMNRVIREEPEIPLDVVLRRKGKRVLVLRGSQGSVEYAADPGQTPQRKRIDPMAR